MNMTKTIKTVLGAIALAATGTASASDAVLTSISGVALVSQGESYLTAHEQAPLATGDRVMVMEGGSAVITYADGCAYTLNDAKVLSIGSQSPCDAGHTATKEMGKRYAAAAGANPAAVLIPLAGGAAMLGAGVAGDMNNGSGNISPQ